MEHTALGVTQQVGVEQNERELDLDSDLGVFSSRILWEEMGIFWLDGNLLHFVIGWQEKQKDVPSADGFY